MTPIKGFHYRQAAWWARTLNQLIVNKDVIIVETNDDHKRPTVRPTERVSEIMAMVDRSEDPNATTVDIQTDNAVYRGVYQAVVYSHVHTIHMDYMKNGRRCSISITPANKVDRDTKMFAWLSNAIGQVVVSKVYPLVPDTF